MSRNGKAWKFKRALLQKEEPGRAKTLSNVMFLQDLLSDATKTSEGKVVFNFGIRLRHMVVSHILHEAILKIQIKCEGRICRYS